MTLVELIKKEAPEARRKLLGVATLAGLANAAIMGAVNAASKNAGHLNTRAFLLFALSILLFVICSRYTFHQTANILEKTLFNIKTRLVDKIRRVEVQALEQVGSSEIYDRLTENVTTISASVNIIAYTLESLLIVVFAGVYVASISFTAFVVLVAINGLWVATYFAKHQQVKTHLQEAASARVEFVDTLTDLLTGFKQIKLNRQRSEEVRQDANKIAGTMQKTAIHAHVVFSDNLLIGNANLYLLLGGVVFLLPQYDASSTSSVTTIIGAVLFFWGPLQSVIAGIPSFMRANLAMENISALEEKLEESEGEELSSEEAVDPWGGQFSTIELRDLEFSYRQEDEAFHIGPLTLSIAAGELIFIVGGNGSGKSTFMKVLTGLYLPTAGTLSVDGVATDRQNIQAYRQLISIVFTDFHLFKKLYGVPDERRKDVHLMLKQMQLEHKTSFAKGRFTDLNLSTGQRKRLALVVALLEDRQFYAFDELAADQDPEFRRYFYRDLLPDLKRRGKTVIVISHDDRYFDAADRIVTMEYGQIRSIADGAHWSAPAD